VALTRCVRYVGLFSGTKQNQKPTLLQQRRRAGRCPSTVKVREKARSCPYTNQVQVRNIWSWKGMRMPAFSAGYQRNAANVLPR